MGHISNHEISRLLYEMALLYDMEGVQFKPRAYEKVAENVEELDREVADIYREGGVRALRTIPNVGEGIAHHIELLLKTGTFPEYERLRKKIPVKLDELMGIGGLGPKSIKTLYGRLKIKDLSSLEAAARTGKIAKLPHFGKKSQKKILKGIEFSKKGVGRFLLGTVDPIVRKIEERLRKVPGVGHVTTAGSYRRRQETIGDIDILVTVNGRQGQSLTNKGLSLAAQHLMDVFTHMPDVAEVLAHGPTKSMVRLKSGIQCDVRVLPEKSYGAALQYFTGSKEHNVETRKIAIKKGLKLNEYGLFRGKRMVAGRTEEEVYKKLGLQWMEPEIRTASGELEAARQTFLQQRKKLGGQARGLPNLIPYGSLRGDLQVQSNWTDGAHSIEQMARAAAQAGLEYIAITDHTRSLAMTGGLDERKLAQQGKTIDKLNQELRIKNHGLSRQKRKSNSIIHDSSFIILKSAEVNVLKDGRMDIDDKSLRALDLVCVAVHSHFNLPEREQTERIIRAIKHPLVNILFHPTGRKIQKREPYAIDMGKIIRAAKQYGVALEVNAAPERLDLKDLHIREAVEAGAKLVIDSDAHAAAHFKWLDFGIAQARRGWTTARDVLNTLPCEEFLKALKGLKRRK